MKRQGWFIPIIIVAINALAIIIRWSYLTEFLPAHYDLQGTAGGTMPRIHRRTAEEWHRYPNSQDAG